MAGRPKRRARLARMNTSNPSFVEAIRDALQQPRYPQRLASPALLVMWGVGGKPFAVLIYAGTRREAAAKAEAAIAQEMGVARPRVQLALAESFGPLNAMFELYGVPEAHAAMIVPASDAVDHLG